MASNSEVHITAFFGYKGGAGRSLLAANVAVVLAATQKKVLLIDWDLEAPGIGDYLDSISRRSEEDSISEEWHRKPGVFDLLAECADSPKANVEGKIKNFLNLNKIKVQDNLHLLGPGRLWDRDYDATVMSSNWLGFYRVHGKGFPKNFCNACEQNSYQNVIIDTRTGTNISTNYILTSLADRVFFVSPRTHQALEGTNRIWKLVEQARRSDDRPGGSQYLILARHEGDSNEDDSPTEYIRQAFQRNPDFQFPQLSTIKSGEELFFEGSELGRYILDPRTKLDDDKLRYYGDSFTRLCKTVDESVDFAYIKSKILFEDKSPSSVTDLCTALKEYLSKAELAAKAGSGTSRDKNQATEEEEAERAFKYLRMVYNRLQPFDRSRFKLSAAQSLRVLSGGQGLENTKYYEKLRELFLLEKSYVDQSNEAMGECKQTSLQESQPEQSKSDALLTVRQKPSIARSSLSEAIQVQEADDPGKALELLDDALQKLLDAGTDERKEERALLTWWKAVVLHNMSRWPEALTDVKTISEERDAFPPDTKRTRADFNNLHLLLALARIYNAHLSPDDAMELEEVSATLLADSGRSKEERADDLCEIAEYSLSRVQVGKGAKTSVESEELDELIRSLDNYRQLQNTGQIRTRTRLSADSARNYALRTRDTGGEDRTYLDRLTSGRAEVDAYMKDPSADSAGPPSAQDIISLAAVHIDCGKRLEGFDLYQDALQVLNRTPDRIVARVNSIAYIGLVEHQLGRPDLAIETWESLEKAWPGDQAPKGSRRKELSAILPWWRWVAEYEKGDFYNAWEGLRQEEEEIPSRAEVGDYKNQLTSIKYFLPQIAAARGEFGKVARLTKEWEEQLDGLNALEIDLPRRLATCRLSLAQASYCLNNDTTRALDLIREGKNFVASSAKAFGSRCTLVYLELRLLEAEILAFGGAEVETVELQSIEKELEFLGDQLLYVPGSTPPSPNECRQGWYYTDLARVATAMAIAAAIYLKRENRSKGRNLANEVNSKWLLFAAEARLADVADNNKKAEWIDRITAVPEGLAQAVSSALVGLGETGLAPVLPKQSMQDGQRARYRQILDFCKGVAENSQP